MNSGITGASFALAGLIFLVAGLKRLFVRKNAENRWTRREAVMTGEAERRVFGRLVLFDPVMTYSIGENSYVTRIRTGDARSIHQKDGRYSLLCSPENPEAAMFELDRADVIIMRVFIGFGCVLLAVGQLCAILM